MTDIVDYTPPKGWQRGDIITASVCINLLALALPFVILQIYDRILPNAAYSTLSFLIGGLIGAILMDVLLRICRSAILSSAGVRYEHNASIAALDKLLGCDVNEFESRSASNYAEDFNAIGRLREFYAGQPATLIADLPFAVIFLCLIAIIAGWLVVVPTFVLSILLLVSWKLCRKMRDILQTRTETDKRRYDFLHEVFEGIHSIKAMAMERVMFRRYERLQAQSAKTNFYFSRAHNTGMAVGQLFSQLSIVSVVTVGSIYVVGGEITMGGLAACSMLTGRVLQPVLRSIGFWASFQGLRIAQEKTKQIMTLPPESNFIGTHRQSVNGRVTFSNVSIRYDASEPILDAASFDIRPGEMVGITGDNGCGKTTILNLMMGLLTPDNGQVHVDNVPIENFNSNLLRQQIGYMPDHAALFEGTILENVSIFQDGDAQARAIEVLKFLGLANYIAGLPQGLETVLSGTNADKIPAGIRQRLVLARALVNAPAIVLFDNANTGLDAAADQELIDAFKAMKRTRTIIIACHRPSYLKICDKILVVKNGKVEEHKTAEAWAQKYGFAPPPKKKRTKIELKLQPGAA